MLPHPCNTHLQNVEGDTVPTSSWSLSLAPMSLLLSWEKSFLGVTMTIPIWSVAETAPETKDPGCYLVTDARSAGRRDITQEGLTDHNRREEQHNLLPPYLCCCNTLIPFCLITDYLQDHVNTIEHLDLWETFVLPPASHTNGSSYNWNFRINSWPKYCLPLGRL